jgi:chitodextrinase
MASLKVLTFTKFYLLLTLVFLSLSLIIVKGVTAATYYISPGGNDSSSGSDSAPWLTFSHAFTILQPGDILYLMDGTYSYSGNNTGSPDAVLSVTVSGTSNNPIIVEALNEGKAVIDGQKVYNCVSIRGQSWVEIDGMNFINSGLDAVTVADGSTYISFRRDFVRDFGWADDDCHSTGTAAFYTADSTVSDPTMHTNNILLEDSAIYMSGFNGNTVCGCPWGPGGLCANGSRIGVNNWSSNNTYRRVWIGWDPNLGEIQDATSFQNYGSSNNIVENCFFDSTYESSGAVESLLLSHVMPYNTGTIANNTAVGNIILNGSGYSIIVDDNSTQAHPTNDLLKDNVSIGSTWGFANEGDDNFHVTNNNIVNTTNGKNATQPDPALITISSCDPQSCSPQGSGSILNTYSLNNSYYGCTDVNPNYSNQAGGIGASLNYNTVLGTVQSQYDNFGTCTPIFTDPDNYIHSAPSTPLTIAASYDTATFGNGAYLMVPPSLQGDSQVAGAYHMKTKSSYDIGAEVLYQYNSYFDNNGNLVSELTNNPLWPWPMEDRIFSETGTSVTWAASGGIWKTLNGVYPATSPDVTPPTTPASFTATVVSASQINLTWSASTDDVGVAGYKVYRNGMLVTAVAGTSYSDTGLTASTAYSYAVAAYDAAGNLSSQSGAVWANTPPVYVYVSDLQWVGTPVNGWGPVEKDMSNGEQAAGDGHTISLHGVTYAKGLGCHAQSVITYNLGGQYTRFVSDIGIDDEVGSGGSVVFQVWADGTKLYDSGIMTHDSVTQHVDVDVTGKSQLQLVVNPGGGISNDHSDWAGACLAVVPSSGGTPDTTPPTVPTGLTATPVLSSQINLAWSASTDNVGVKGYKIYRNGSLLASVTAGSSYQDTGLTASTTYSYTVSAYDAAGNESSQSAPVLATSLAAITYISDLQWVGTPINGWGPVEKDMSNGEQYAGDGHTITLHGVKYAKGLGTHAKSVVTYNLAGKYSEFMSDMGIDDETGGYGSVIFQVWGDATKLYDSGIMGAASATQHANVSVAGVNTLQLIVLVGNTPDDDHADWAGAYLVTGPSGSTPPPDTTPPTVPGSLTATPVSASEIDLAWSASTDNVGVAGYKIYRNGSPTPVALVTTGTSYADAGLAASTTYTYSVSACDAAGNESPQSGPVPATTLSAGSVFISDLTWTSATNGWGPVEKDMSNGEQYAGDGHTITLHGVKYAKGLGTHAKSVVTYNLAGKYSEFMSDIGIDDETGGYGSVIFQVWGDATKLYDSGIMGAASATQHVNVSVAGVNTLQLIVLVGNTTGGDHADWAGAQLSY